MPFEERGYVYYLDQRHPATGERRRLYVIPSGGTALGTMGTEPAWGEAPGVGTLWRQILGEAIEIFEPGETAFEKIPVGLAAPGTRKVVIHWDEVTATDGLNAVLTLEETAVTLSLASGVTESAVARNLWTIVADTDHPTGTDPSVWRCVFQGVQRKLPTRPGTIMPYVGCSQELELTDVGRAITEMVSMAVVCRALVAADDEGVVTYAEDDFPLLNPEATTYDVAWLDDDLNMRWFGAQQRHEEMNFMTLGTFFAGMEGVLQLCYEALVRGAFTSPTLTLHGHPLSHWTFSKQTRSSALTKGATLDTDTEVAFQAWTTFVDGPSVNTTAGGLLIPQSSDEDTWATTQTVFDWLHQAALGFVSKGRFRQTERATLDLHFGGAYTTLDGRTEITLEDIIVDEEEPAIEFTEGEGVVASARVSISSTGSEDITEGSLSLFGTEGEQGTAVTAPLHNLPTVGSALSTDDWSVTVRPYWTASENRGWIRPTHNWFNLYYVESATDAQADRELVFRVHHEAEIDHGAGITTTTTTAEAATISLPTDYPINGGYITDSTDFLKSVLAAFLALQNAAGVLYGVPAAYAQLFGNAGQTTYTLRVPRTLIDRHQIGEPFDLAPAGSGGAYSAQALAATDAVDLSHLKGGCIAIRITPDVGMDEDEEGAPPIPLSEVVLLGVRS